MKMKRWTTPVLFFAAACASTPMRDFTGASTAAETQVRALVGEKKIPGAAVAVAAGDRIVWHQTFGVADLESKRGVTAHTRFRVGSVTKLITAAALMRLVEQGRLSLDDRVARYLPAFPHGEITLRQLAGHLSGIRHYSNDEFINTTHYANTIAALAKFAADPLIAPPGEKYLYSTYGYDVLGAVIEKVTGKRFDDAARMLVLDPAGMSETSFADSLASAAAYDLDKTGPRPAVRVDLSDRLPAGALVTTARDLARFLIAMTGNRLLAEETVATMFTSQSTSDGKPTNVGIAWRVAKDSHGRTYVHHAGAVTGGRAAVVLYPAERIGVAIVTNLGFAAFNEKDAAAVAERFLDAR